MSGFAKASDRLIGILAALGLCLGAVSAMASGDAPARVVSVNLCTDQLAMMLAAPGQLISVSALATDRSSAMQQEARAYPKNMGQAEQVFLMRPDLVLAGTYTARASVDLLRRLGVEVVELAPATSLDDVSKHLRIVGQALGREVEAEAMIAQYEADLSVLSAAGQEVFTAAMYYPNGYTTGSGTLANDILETTGFRNIGAEAGVSGGGILPLERLVMAAPEMIVTSTPYPGASRSEEILVHPALSAVRARAGQAQVADADWICGTPIILRAVAAMARAHDRLEVAR